MLVAARLGLELDCGKDPADGDRDVAGDTSESSGDRFGFKGFGANGNDDAELLLLLGI